MAYQSGTTNPGWGQPQAQGYPAAAGGGAPNQGAQTQRTGPSDLIAKAAAKGKFLDFRNNLIPALYEDYANIHGTGGAKHAAKSTIKVLITDYSAGRNAPSIVVSANAAPELIPYMLCVCEKNAATAALGPAQGGPASAVASRLTMSTALPAGQDGKVYLAVAKADLDVLAQAQLPQEAAALLDSAMHSTPLPPDARTGAPYFAVDRTLVEQLATAATVKPGGAGNGGTNFSYKQERVNIYQKKEGGFCPVSVMSITRTGTRKGGEVSRLPWTVQIKNFLAMPVQQANGTTAYNGRTVKDIKEAFVSISDFDMFRCLYRTNRFIELWENAVGMQLVQRALAEKAAARAPAQTGGYGFDDDFENF